MRVVYHPAVQKDVNAILRYYDAISNSLGDEFWEELLACVRKVAESPERYHLVAPGLRRANLHRFPYHLLFRIIPDGIRITIVKHHKRNPRLGTKRS